MRETLVQPAVAPGAEPMPELRLCGVDDRTVHRCHPLLPEDRLVIEGLARLDDRLPGEAFDVQPRGPERGPDDLPDQLQRIDDLLTWTMARTAFLPHRHIEPGVLPSVIEHACAVGLPLGIAVFSDAAMHAVQDTVQSVAHAAGVMAVGTEEAILEIRPAAVQQGGSRLPFRLPVVRRRRSRLRECWPEVRWCCSRRWPELSGPRPAAGGS